jgi:hypothetical protein
VSIGEDVAAQIKALRRHKPEGSLCFFGEWFGGRPDNIHRMTEAEGRGDAFVLHFSEGETLAVWDPSGVTITKQAFRIERASRVLWEWFYYGRPKQPENRYAIEYVRVDDGRIEVRDTAEWAGQQHAPDPSAPAVEMAT